MSWSVYAIYSKEFNRIYIGMSENPAIRLKQHNAGKTSSTKPYRPWILVYTEEIGGRAEARKREKELKSTNGRRFIKGRIHTN